MDSHDRPSWSHAGNARQTAVFDVVQDYGFFAPAKLARDAAHAEAQRDAALAPVLSLRALASTWGRVLRGWRVRLRRQGARRGWTASSPASARDHDPLRWADPVAMDHRI